MIIVAFPLLLILSWLIQKEMRQDPEKHELKFRKWLVYLTLFITAIAIVIDLIQLVYRFYGGDLTTPFTLKVLAVLLLAGAVFGYYVWDVQSVPHQSKVPRAVGWSATVVVFIILVSGFFLVGSPLKQREIRMDEQRIADLQNLQGSIVTYWQYKDELPSSLGVLQNDLTGFIPAKDPETNQDYEYKILGPLQFQLCATFLHPNPYRDQKEYYEPIPYPTSYVEGYYAPSYQVWDHGAGLTCFERTIDPDLYPKPEKR
jgi:uncharacterized membrane protein YjfL (UPF0719 family)